MGYESLFTPFKIGNMEVKNRIGLSPMGTNSAFTNGRKDAQEIDYSPSFSDICVRRMPQIRR